MTFLFGKDLYFAKHYGVGSKPVTFNSALSQYAMLITYWHLTETLVFGNKDGQNPYWEEVLL